MKTEERERSGAVPAAVYLRISSDPQGRRAGVKRQRKDCFELATRKGWSVADRHVFEDNDRTAYRRGKRPAYARMLDAIRSGEVRAVVAWHEDRLHRHPMELEEFIELCDATGTLIATVQYDTDLSTADGRFRARIMGAVARKESEDKSRRLRRMHEELAESGRWIGGGQRPFGYDRIDRPARPGEGSDRGTVKTLRPHPKEARVVREMVARALRGESLTRVARDLNEAGVTTAEGERWKTGILKRVLLNPVLAGLRVHRRTGRVVKGEWPGVITPEEHKLLKARLNGNGAPAARPGPLKYPLTGLVRCARCGQRMLGSAGNYRCATIAGGCGKTRISAPRLEEVVLEAVYAAWSLDDSRSPGSNASSRTLELTKEELEIVQELHEVEERRLQLAEKYVDLGMTPAQFQRANARLEKMEQELRRRLNDEAPPTKPKAPAMFGEAMASAEDFERRRAAGELTPAEVQGLHDWTAAYVERIVIKPSIRRGRVFDPSRVRLIGRTGAARRPS